MAEPFAPQVEEPRQRNWAPIIVGLVVVVVVVAAIVFFGRNKDTGPAKPHPYSEKIAISDIKLSQAENFVGSTVTYLDLKVTNNGDKTVAGGQIEVDFKNSLGQVAQKEVLPLRILQPNQMAGYPDLIDIAQSPLAPGQTKTIRLTLEHVSGDWDQTYPDLKLLNLKLK